MPQKKRSVSGAIAPLLHRKVYWPIIVSDVVEKTSTRRGSRIPCVVRRDRRRTLANNHSIQLSVINFLTVMTWLYCYCKAGFINKTGMETYRLTQMIKQSTESSITVYKLVSIRHRRASVQSELSILDNKSFTMHTYT